MSRIEIDTAVVASVVREIMTTLEGDLSGADLKLYGEVEKLADYLRNARREIADLETATIREHHIPAATDELDAIVAATEEATGAILDSAEQVEQVASVLDGAEAEKLAGAVTRIYESCNFQDITGQRIGKIVKTLKHIEQTVDGLVEAFGSSGASAKPREPEQGEAALLNGPALPTEAVSQADIDALLASFD